MNKQGFIIGIDNAGLRSSIIGVDISGFRTSDIIIVITQGGD